MHKALVEQFTYPLHERLVNRPTFSCLKEWEASQWLSRADMEALQLKKLKDLLRTGMLHCPWYAQRITDAGLDITEEADSFTLNDMRRLPLMDKVDAMANQQVMVWQGVPGNHGLMVKSPNVEVLAEKLQRALYLSGYIQ